MIKDTTYTDNIVCPFCGYEDHDSWEVDFGPGIEGDINHFCGSCEKEFFVMRQCDVTYSSFEKKK